MELSTRLKKLPPYLFAEIDKKKKAAVAAGRDVINLGIGDPDMPTPRFVIDALAEAARNPATHRYALDNGDPAFLLLCNIYEHFSGQDKVLSANGKSSSAG